MIAVSKYKRLCFITISTRSLIRLGFYVKIILSFEQRYQKKKKKSTACNGLMPGLVEKNGGVCASSKPHSRLVWKQKEAGHMRT